MHRPILIREDACLLAPNRGREDDVGELRGLCQEGVADDDEQVLLLENRPDPVQLGQRHGRVGAEDPEELDRPLLTVPEDLHCVCRRRPARDLERVDVPVRRKLADVIEVLPVAHPGRVAVRAALACVLRRRLSVQLKRRCARLADHPAEQIHVVHLTRRRGCLMRLIDALQAGRDEPLPAADDPRRLPDVVGLNAADPRRALRRISDHCLAELFEADRVLGDKALVDPAVGNQLVLDRV